MKKLVIAVALGVMLLGPTTVHATTALDILKSGVGIVHTVLHVAESVVSYAMTPIHSVLNSLGTTVEEHN